MTRGKYYFELRLRFPVCGRGLVGRDSGLDGGLVVTRGSDGGHRIEGSCLEVAGWTPCPPATRAAACRKGRERWRRSQTRLDAAVCLRTIICVNSSNGRRLQPPPAPPLHLLRHSGPCHYPAPRQVSFFLSLPQYLYWQC